MINFLKNNLYRIGSRKYSVLTAVLMVMASITLAVYFNSKVQTKISVAVVADNKPVFDSKYVKADFLEKEPPKHQLVLGKYDGVFVEKENGKFEVITIKNNEERRRLQELANNPENFLPKTEGSRGIGTNIIGYLLLFILLQCVLFMFTLSGDIESKQIERIAAAPVSFTKYLLAHFICTITIIFAPAMIILLVMKVIIGVDIGFSLLQYGGLLGILCALGTSFAMFINSMVKVSDTANMMGSSIVLLTTILSGSFYSFGKGNEALEKIIAILPQKAFLSFVQGLEGGKAISAVILQLAYVIIIVLVFFVFSIIKIRKDYVLRSE